MDEHFYRTPATHQSRHSVINYSLLFILASGVHRDIKLEKRRKNVFANDSSKQKIALKLSSASRQIQWQIGIDITVQNEFSLMHFSYCWRRYCYRDWIQLCVVLKTLFITIQCHTIHALTPLHARTVRPASRQTRHIENDERTAPKKENWLYNGKWSRYFLWFQFFFCSQ